MVYSPTYITPLRIHMKYLILLLLPFLTFAEEQRLLISGFSIHEKSQDRFDETYNAFNYGVGYEYNFFQAYDEIYFGTNVLLLKDSFENAQLSIGFGHHYRIQTGSFDTDIGINGFVGLKKIYTDDDLSRDDGEYKFTGGIGPSLIFYKDQYSINFMYLPSFKYKDVEITGFLFTYFSYKF